MGKQVNYYMDYESFLKIAQAALDEGCLILTKKHTPEPPIPHNSISAITEDQTSYYFYLPELGELEYGIDKFGNYYVQTVGAPLSIATIEASYSKYHDKTNGDAPFENYARLYIQTGYYKNHEWIPRSERITKVYDKLAGMARKLAPSTTVEADDIDYNDAGGVEPVKRTYKAYISPMCLEWRSQGYELYWLLASQERYRKYIKQQGGAPILGE